MIMRIKLAKFVALFIVLVNVIVVYYTLKLFLSFNSEDAPPRAQANQVTTKSPTKHLSKLLTIVIREFELYENDVTLTVKSFTNIFPHIQTLIICDTLPYPPLTLSFWNSTHRNVKIINLSTNLKAAYIEQYPLVHIKTKYVLFVPDSTRLPSRQTLLLLFLELLKEKEQLVVAPVGFKTNLNCLRLNVSVRTWSLKYETIRSSLCDGVNGKHVTMMETDDLKRFTNAFLLPFPQSLYLQASAQNLKVKLPCNIFFELSCYLLLTAV